MHKDGEVFLHAHLKLTSGQRWTKEKKVLVNQTHTMMLIFFKSYFSGKYFYSHLLHIFEGKKYRDFFSHIFSWMTPILKKGFKLTLGMNDFFIPTKDDQTLTVYQDLQKYDQLITSISNHTKIN